MRAPNAGAAGQQGGMLSRPTEKQKNEGRAVRLFACRPTESGAEHFAHLVDVAQTKEGEGRSYVVLVQSPAVVAEDGQVTTPT